MGFFIINNVGDYFSLNGVKPTSSIITYNVGGRDDCLLSSYGWILWSCMQPHRQNHRTY
jgi:hypothetical protein